MVGVAVGEGVGLADCDNDDVIDNVALREVVEVKVSDPVGVGEGVRLGDAVVDGV